MHKPKEAIKLKVFLGYFFLVAMASFSVWFIYAKTSYLTRNQDRIGLLNTKMLYFNAVLTNMYHAEALERSYVQTANPVYLKNYEILMDQILNEIDSMSSLAINPAERLHTDSILHLLDDKRQNLKDLVAFKKDATSYDIYNKALDRLYAHQDTSDSLIKAVKSVSDSIDSTYVQHKRKSFFKRLAYAFSANEKHDSSLLIKTIKAINTDSVYTKYDPADSVRKILEDAIAEIRNEDLRYAKQLSMREKQALAKDHFITLQLRQILSLIEKDILLNSIQEFRSVQSKIRETTWYLALIGIVALFVTILFLVLIMKDLTRSRQYRNQLEIAKDYSDSLLRSKEQFMLSITHDIKTPVASLVGYAQLMNQTNDKEQKGVYMDRINNSAEHILKLINDLVDLSKLETGKLAIELRSFLLEELVQDAYQSFYPIAKAKGLEFTLENTIPSWKKVHTDHDRIMQILGNILSNAIKYTYNGSVHFRVFCESKTSGFEEIGFVITDTGIGISEEHQKEVFKEFARFATSDFDHQNEGAGLGLAIAKRLIMLLGGTITFESTPGMGSKFTVIMPVQSVDSEIQPEKGEKPGSDSIPVFQMQSRLLVIDDDPVYLEMIRKILTQSGLHVIAVNEPLSALRVLQDNKIDLIITDIWMPSIKGTDLLAYIQKKTGRHIPVIAITGADSFKIEDYPGIIIAGILKKPVMMKDLFDQIAHVLQTPLDTKSANIFEKNSTEKKEYDLTQINSFAVNDPVSIHQILTSFVEMSYEHLEHFQEYLIRNDRKSLSDLAHKMLAMFRQIEAHEIVVPLIELEKNIDLSLNDPQWRELGMKTLAKIEQLINRISEEQHIYIRM